jgi:hypothetical protein
MMKRVVDDTMPKDKGKAPMEIAPPLGPLGLALGLPKVPRVAPTDGAGPARREAWGEEDTAGQPEIAPIVQPLAAIKIKPIAAPITNHTAIDPVMAMSEDPLTFSEILGAFDLNQVIQEHITDIGKDPKALGQAMDDLFYVAERAQYSDNGHGNVMQAIAEPGERKSAATLIPLLKSSVAYEDAEAAKAALMDAVAEDEDEVDPLLMQDFQIKIMALAAENVQLLMAEARAGQDKVKTALENAALADDAYLFLDAKTFKPGKEGEGTLKTEFELSKAQVEGRVTGTVQAANPVTGLVALEKFERSDALATLEDEIGRLVALHHMLKTNGAGLADLQQLWEAVPLRMRLDEVVEELRPFYFAHHLLEEETDANIAAAKDSAKIALATTGVPVLAGAFGTVACFLAADHAASGSDAIDQLTPQDKETLSEKQADGTRDRGVVGEKIDEPYEDYNKTILLTNQCLATVHDLLLGANEAIKREENKRSKANEMIANRQQELKDIGGFAVENRGNIQKARMILTQIFGRLQLLGMSWHPVVRGALKIVQGQLRMCEGIELRIKALEAEQQSGALAKSQPEMSRGSGSGKAGKVIEATLSKQAKRLEMQGNATLAIAASQTVAGAGMIGTGLGEVTVSPIVALLGSLMQGGATAFQTCKTILNMSEDASDDAILKELLKRAHAGDADAKIEVMESSSFYCAMYLAHAAKEGDAEALDVLSDMHFHDEKDFAEHDVYLMRKAITWALGQSDLNPEAKSVIEDIVKGITSFATSAYDTVTKKGRNITSLSWPDDPKDVKFHAPELTAQCWHDYKTEAYKHGIWYQATGVSKLLDTYEQKLQLTIRDDQTPNYEAFDDCADALAGVIVKLHAYKPKWHNRKKGTTAPQGAIDFKSGMANLAGQKRVALLAKFQDGGVHYDQTAAPPPQKYNVELTSAAFTAQLELASQNKVDLNGKGEAKKAIDAYEGLVADFHAKRCFATYDPLIAGITQVKATLGALTGHNIGYPGENENFTTYVANMIKECDKTLETLVDLSEGEVNRFNATSVKLVFTEFTVNLLRARKHWLREDDAHAKLEKPVTDKLVALNNAYLATAEVELETWLTENGALAADYIKYHDTRSIEFQAMAKLLAAYAQHCGYHRPWQRYLRALKDEAEAASRRHDTLKLVAQKPQDTADAPKADDWRALYAWAASLCLLDRHPDANKKLQKVNAHMADAFAELAKADRDVDDVEEVDYEVLGKHCSAAQKELQDGTFGVQSDQIVRALGAAIIRVM